MRLEFVDLSHSEAVRYPLPFHASLPRRRSALAGLGLVQRNPNLGDQAIVLARESFTLEIQNAVEVTLPLIEGHGLAYRSRANRIY